VLEDGEQAVFAAVRDPRARRRRSRRGRSRCSRSSSCPGTAGMLLWGPVRTYLDDPAVEESSSPCSWPRSVGTMGVAVLVLVAIWLVPAVV